MGWNPTWNKEINCIIRPPAAEELETGQTKPIIKVIALVYGYKLLLQSKYILIEIITY
jgi:hypothetical protein